MNLSKAQLARLFSRCLDPALGLTLAGQTVKLWLFIQNCLGVRFIAPLFGQARFVSVEGTEGAGKSVFTAALAAMIRACGAEVVTTREPGGTLVADQIRALFASPPPGESLTPTAEALLVSAARAQHLEYLIRPALARGAWVICDRFADSTRVYQGTLGGLPIADLEALIAFSTAGQVPDLTFILDCPVALAAVRLQQRLSTAKDDAIGDTVERFDQAPAAVHERMRQGFLTVLAANPGRCVRLDASLTPEQLLGVAWVALEERFGGN